MKGPYTALDDAFRQGGVLAYDDTAADDGLRRPLSGPVSGGAWGLSAAISSHPVAAPRCTACNSGGRKERRELTVTALTKIDGGAVLRRRVPMACTRSRHRAGQGACPRRVATGSRRRP
jgi:hypothetical protein